MEEIGSNACARPGLEKKPRPPEQLNCPRCNSTNTKFCYYNNYSLTQPRYFCKTCRRYWTEGGSLRNVPVGGGSRKNKRSSSLAASSSASVKIPDLNPPTLSQFSSHQNPKTTHEGQDLNLGFPAQGMIPHYVEVPKAETNKDDQHNNSASYNSPHLSALELLRSGINSRSLSSFIPSPMPDSNALYPSGFPLEFKPSLSFSVDGLGLGNRYGGHQESGGRNFSFPFGDMKQLSSSNEVDQKKEQGTSGGYWNGMLGGGSW
ncbi:hypothetical protein K2173_025238 [Erythroxylum novogranatense]|uniref:Dof zinc finger protein n=1 Tax=Erythroxylum novogranatense TaxID=1862640 RepID=A0AAV8UIH0_9ROSI|nr:hypothetical protein K2173_025238 [Erythroxylum novogranatense]